jgi:hypothetical protein
MIETVFEDIIYLPVKSAIFFKHKTGGITKGGIKRLCGLLCHWLNQELFLGDRVNKDLTYHHAFLKKRPIFLKKKAIPKAPATMTCTR